jgi:predicted transposase YdaD
MAKRTPGDYDAALKRLLTSLTGTAFRLFTGADPVVRWHTVELPAVRNLRVDLLGETARGILIHIELQSTNDPRMPLRMLEYALAIRRKYGRFPVQIVLYVGEAPLTMPSRIEGPGLVHEFRVVDAREIDGEALLASPHVEDNIVAVLTRLRNRRTAVRRIVKQVAELEPGRRDDVIATLGVLAGLRQLEDVIFEEIDAMPLLDDIMDHKIIGPKIREGIEIGRRQGREEGLEKGLAHERRVLRRQIEKRFGVFPDWAVARLDELGPDELESTALRLLDVASVDDLFRS